MRPRRKFLAAVLLLAAALAGASALAGGRAGAAAAALASGLCLLALGPALSLSRTAVARGRLEEALATARATLEASADGVLVVDRSLRVVTYNRRFAAMWGLTDVVMNSGDVRRMAESVMHLTEDPAGFLALATSGGEDERKEERRDLLRLKDGRVFERISQPYSLDGRPIGRTITMRDMTLHFEGVRALAQARDEAVETARLKSQFLANASHELRTPLNAVVGAAELLGSTRLDAEQRELADTLARAARTLLETMDGVLDFSKIEAGRMAVERTRLRPGAVLADAAALIAPRAAEKGLALRVDAGAAPEVELLGDPTRLRQVLLNLLSNAVKFTEKGGVEAAARVLSADAASVELEFSVRDTGIGIPADQAPRLFAPFVQGDGSTTRRYGGTGLGLAISRSLVELMGGEIGFDSAVGSGTRFWVRLRLDRAGAAAPAPPAAGPEPRPGRRDRLRVLVVEDNGTNRRLLVRQFERLGCPCETAADGRAALAAAGAADFGLILMDCQMPGLDGFAAAAEIRRRETGRRRTPIVAITANASADDRRRCLDAGMDDFMTKPATLDALSAALDRWDAPFDEAALAGFAAVVADSPAALGRLLAQFLGDTDARLRAARTALARGDREACAREAHALKGAAAAIGARGLGELCRRVEEAVAWVRPAPELESLLGQAVAEAARARADAARRAAA